MIDSILNDNKTQKFCILAEEKYKDTGAGPRKCFLVLTIQGSMSKYLAQRAKKQIKLLPHKIRALN